jgi:flagellar basal-body rod protein FlgG
MALMALQSASTGLRALSTELDVIANNLANVNNNGFQASRANFEDIYYQQVQQPGVQDANSDTRPIGLQIGLGTRISGTQLDFTAGSQVTTGKQTDVYISGNGFFRAKVLPGQGDGFGYTRAGSFFINAAGQLTVDSQNGYLLDPQITVPTDATAINIGADGRVYATLPTSTNPSQIGQIQLTRFVNPEGLIQIGGNMYQQSGSSGDPITANPGTDGMGSLVQGSVEASNVDPTTELVEMIKTQRSYELNSQAIQTANQMLQTLNQLRQ